MAILLQSTPDGIERDHIVAKLSEIEQVDDVHDLHIWSLDEEYNVLTVHLALKEQLSMQELAVLKERIRAMLESEDIQHATIEFETPDEACHLASCASESL
jgi:cobalt-zinc-cadmium efflux system protein